MRWHSSSTIDSKKRAIPRLRSATVLFGTVIGLMLVAQSVPAADLALVVFPDDDALAVDAAITEYHGASVIETVHEGLQAEVRFSIQIYRDEVGISGLLGDTLLGEYRPTHMARWDPFGRAYSVTRHDGTETSVRDGEQYVRALFTLKNFRIPVDLFESGRQYYLLGRAAVIPVRLVPALSILSVFTDRQIEYTEWVRFTIPTEIVEILAGGER